MQSFKITISGELGSGKSSLGKLLGKTTGFRIMSVGEIQRELAQKHGMSTLEFNKYMETHPEIDIECDKKVVEYGMTEENLIFDSRMAWHFVPHAFKLHLLVNSSIAAFRIFNDNKRKNEQNNDIEHTLENIKQRKNSEIKRFRERYEVDIDNLYNYDLVIDSSYVDPIKLADFVLLKFEEWKRDRFKQVIFISPFNLIPLQGIREVSDIYTNRIKESMITNGFYEKDPIKVICFKGFYFIFDGHKRCSSALLLNIDLVPIVVINIENDKYKFPFNMSINEYIKDNYKKSNIYDWESCFNFKFADYYEV